MDKQAIKNTHVLPKCHIGGSHIWAVQGSNLPHSHIFSKYSSRDSNPTSITYHWWVTPRPSLPRLTSKDSLNSIKSMPSSSLPRGLGVIVVTNCTTEINTLLGVFFSCHHRDKGARKSKSSSASRVNQPIPDLKIPIWNAENPSSIYCERKKILK